MHICSPRNQNLNFLVRIKILNFFLYYSKIKTEKLTDPNKVLLVLGCRTGGHREVCICTSYAIDNFNVTRE